MEEGRCNSLDDSHTPKERSKRIFSGRIMVTRPARDPPPSLVSTNGTNSVEITDAISEGRTKLTVPSPAPSNTGARKGAYARSERAGDSFNAPSSTDVLTDSATSSFSSTSSSGPSSSGHTSDDMKEIGAPHNDLCIPHDPGAVARSLQHAENSTEDRPKRLTQSHEPKAGRVRRGASGKSTPRRRRTYGRVAQKPEMHEDGNHRKKEDWPSRAQNMDVDKSEQSHSAIVMDKTG